MALHRYHLFAIVVFSASHAGAWISSPMNKVMLGKKSWKSSTNVYQEKEDECQKDSTEWGVSYIGGDPCGSKYNNDPFDTESKPGFPDDMKSRIEALAEKKKLEAKSDSDS
mmetsp:Transcript_1455/g.2212  ORF Transcript_1455/g.2212 Transcript_1455/m.2212 type:complete len:111 (+) Transcript_1455:60-392(+)|eukprot:CAMPEP_0197261014 /NCGR_PEP_ID=MMETSP1429-20130617/84331_1 /TAXON_ID=49237 /ORGANISM="Chaetoceros  sp., Strain UNC1202" /LENGTH=110 /DNA_ID=CAMNT_0042725269 /DNA_START=43 /DNA_END=375 /DNA_ORIENTATION=+